jgi:hypothetical protein
MSFVRFFFLRSANPTVATAHSDFNFFLSTIGNEICRVPKSSPNISSGNSSGEVPT